MFFDMFKALFPPGTEPIAFPLMRKMQGKNSGILTILRGVSPLTLANAIKSKLKSLTQYGKCSVSGSDITCNNGTIYRKDEDLPVFA